MPVPNTSPTAGGSTKTVDKVVEALRDGQQSSDEVAVNAMLSGSQAVSALRTLQNTGDVGWELDQGRRLYFLTGGQS